MTVQNPHDRFFRESFGRPEIVRNYLEEYLPAEVRATLNLETLSRQEGSFIDEAMQAHQTDLLYQVQLSDGVDAYVYFLFEHKSYPDPLVGLQLLRYIVRFWEQQVKEQARLRPILPLVVYHGEKGWHIPTSFGALVDAPDALRSYLPDFRYHLSDFSHVSDETIRGEIWLRVSLSVLRAIFNPRLRQELDQLLTLMFELRDKRTGLEYIRTILYYLSRATERVSRQELETALDRQGVQGEQLMATIAQEYIQEGVEKSILRVLARRFGAVPTEVQTQLDTLTLSDLETLLDAAVEVDDLSAFAARLAAIAKSGG
ncbi:MAG: Rpn family recombination-promoting nuclease/putative transposase [Ardenticatenaceae bacterium]|nr:Rpn family recombination-promoting nuclease/putative transposase [Ardenticatenaceae bacterium]